MSLLQGGPKKRPIVFQDLITALVIDIFARNFQRLLPLPSSQFSLKSDKVEISAFMDLLRGLEAPQVVFNVNHS